MITVENLLDAYAHALDLWIDPELAMLENGHPCSNPLPEYAELIRKAVSAENAKLRELVEDMLDCIDIQIAFERVPARWMQDEFVGRARELGIEVD